MRATSNCLRITVAVIPSQLNETNVLYREHATMGLVSWTPMSDETTAITCVLLLPCMKSR